MKYILYFVSAIGLGFILSYIGESTYSARREYYKGYSKAMSDILAGKLPDYKAIQKDAEVKVSNDAKHWITAYYAGGSKDKIKVWANGATSKTAHGKTETYKYLNLEIFNYVEKVGML